MKQYISILILFAGLWSFASCDKADEIINNLLGNDTVVSGLKTALEVGTDSTVTSVSKVGGYLNDKFIKIPLPENAQKAVGLINDHPVFKVAVSAALGINFDSEVTKMVTALNHAAEGAAKEAAPIFKKAITDLSISDGLTILNGNIPTTAQSSFSTAAFDSTAATGYLKLKTYQNLVNAYGVPVNKILDTGGNASPTAIWTKFSGIINSIATIELPGINNPLNIEPINDNLGEYVTGKALDGLFYKVGGVEKSIRNDPFEWAKKTGKDILSRVFGTK